MEKRDHDHAGFSWYRSTKPGIFNPYNVSDRISRKTWYENVTYPDMKRRIPKATEFKVEPLAMLCGPHNLFTRLSCPNCNQR
jgi:hypothetical protein